MDISLKSLDWSLVQAFLVVAETGSLSAAARQLDTSQPTLGRQVRAMEGVLGVELFHRKPKGLELTEAGTALLPAARAMRKAAGEIALTAAGRSEGLKGVVRITSSIMVSHHLLPPIVARILQRHPEIEIEIVPSDTSENLLFREADIAIRMYRPEQLDVVTRHLGDLELGMFAAKSYFAAREQPLTLEEALSHPIIGLDRSEDLIRGFAQAGIRVDRHFFAVRCDMHTIIWELVRAGCGLGFGQLAIGRNDPTVRQVMTDFPLPRLPVWLAAHEAMRQTPRIRRVWDLLAEGLRPHLT